MNNHSIGVFDSGLGGLTAVKQIMKELPNENIIYFGDTGRVPYGTRSNETIIKYVRGDIRFLRSFDVKIIVAACGTASTVALPALRDEMDVPVIGVVESAVRAAVNATRNHRIGVIGTPSTIDSGAYETMIRSMNADIMTYSRGCPLFVPLVENGHFDTQVTRLVVEEYLAPIKAQGVDTLILGCTHYPLLKQAIQGFMGENVSLIEAGVEIARFLKQCLSAENRHCAQRDANQYRYYVSDNVESFIRLGGTFLQREINGQVNKIDIEQY